MDYCNGAGFIAVVAVSGGVAFIATRMQKRLFLEFMNKIESEFGETKRAKKKEKKKEKKMVSFGGNLINPCSTNEEYQKLQVVSPAMVDGEVKNSGGPPDGRMPLNRKMLYKRMMEYRMLKATKGGW